MVDPTSIRRPELIGMDQYELISTARRVYGKSNREIARETGHHRETIRKALAGKEPKYRRRKPPRCPIMDPVAAIVEGWLEEDRGSAGLGARIQGW